MKFISVTDSSAMGSESPEEEYKKAQKIGRLLLGEKYLYFRSMGKVFYIPYTDISRYFRRVMFVPAKLCCGKGDLTEEYLVLCNEQEKELAQIKLPSAHAAAVVMERMKKLAPSALTGTPDKKKETDHKQV